MNIWDTLYEEAKAVLQPREISTFVYGGQVAAAILTKQGNIYVGVCVDASCGLTICAERNAIFHMITQGESKIDKVVAIASDGKVASPCGSCRELMMQLDKDNKDIEILLDYETKESITLEELMPHWWGTKQFQ